MSLLSDLAAFPEAGPYSIGGFSVPRNSGTVPVTELRNLLDTNWSRTAMDRAVSLTGGQVQGLSCLASSGITNADGSVLGMLTGLNNFDLNGLTAILTSGKNSILGVIGDLQLASSLQSLAAGLANSVSSLARAVFGILDRALTLGGAMAQKLVGMASGLVELAGKAIDLFAGAFDMARNGLLGMGDFSPGEVFSGLAGRLGSMLGGIGNTVLSLTGQAAKLAGDLLSMGIDVLLSPTASLSQLAGLFSPITGALSSMGQGVSEALSKLNMDTLKNVASKIGEALSGVLSSLVSGAAAAASALAGGFTSTVERLQGITLIDGEWKLGRGFSLSTLTQFGLGAYIGSLFGESKSDKIKGALGGGAAMVLLATLLGNSAPVQGSYLVTSPDGWLGSPATASNGITAALGEACAFNAALLAALGAFLDSGTAGIDALMAALECRGSTYSGVYGNALSAQQQTDYLLQRLLGLLGLLGGNYPALCDSSGFALGRCS